MRATEEQHNARKREMMEKCFECYAENGLTGTGNQGFGGGVRLHDGESLFVFQQCR